MLGGAAVRSIHWLTGAKRRPASGSLIRAALALRRSGAATFEFSGAWLFMRPLERFVMQHHIPLNISVISESTSGLSASAISTYACRTLI